MLAALLVTCGTAAAQFTIDVSVDEFGNGTFTNSAGVSAPLPASLGPDPGPGGLPAALTYALPSPPGLVSGDLLLVEPGGEGLVSDQVRFNAQPNGTLGSTLVFYSDHFDGPDSLADNGFPTARYTNTVSLVEVGGELGPNGITYTPTDGQPGFVALAGGPVTYHVTSDAAVPEPSTMPTLLPGLAGGALFRRRRGV